MATDTRKTIGAIALPPHVQKLVAALQSPILGHAEADEGEAFGKACMSYGQECVARAKKLRREAGITRRQGRPRKTNSDSLLSKTADHLKTAPLEPGKWSDTKTAELIVRPHFEAGQMSRDKKNQVVITLRNRISAKRAMRAKRGASRKT